MHSYSAWQAAGPEPAGGRRAQVLAALSERIADRRAGTSPQRDPDFIRRVLPAIARYTSYFTPERARSRRHRPRSRRPPDPVFQAPQMRDNGQAPAPFKVPVGR